MATHTEDWVSIAEQITVEMDAAKLMTLVEQLCNALDRRRQAISPVRVTIEKNLGECASGLLRLVVENNIQKRAVDL